MTANQKALLEDAQDTAVENGKGIASMIGRVRKQLMLLAANPDKGPYYAAAVLHSVHAKDLSNRVDGFIVENQNNLNMAMNDMTLRQNSMANALRELQNSNMINRGGRAERYVQTVNAYYRQEAKLTCIRQPPTPCPSSNVRFPSCIPSSSESLKRFFTNSNPLLPKTSLLFPTRWHRTTTMP